MWFANRSDTNQDVQSQKTARSLKFRIKEEEELYFPSSENKGADQLRGYREADLCLFFVYADCWFSHEAAQMVLTFFFKEILLMLPINASSFNVLVRHFYILMFMKTILSE